jgi:hypothetical protein
VATTAKKQAATPANEELRQKLQVQPPDALVEFLNLFVYGDTGVGKTYLGGTAADDPRTSPVLFVDVEGGLTTIKDRKDIDVVKVRDMKTIERVGTELAQVGKNIYYKTVVIDSLTELADLDMRTVMKIAYNRNPDKVDIDVPSPREWGTVRNHIRIITRHFKDLPCHVMFTGHVGVEQDESLPAKYYPGFAGKLAREIPGFVDIVGYYTQKANSEGVVVRTLQTQGTNRVVAKDRTGALAMQVIDPTIPSLWDAILGERNTSK